MPGPLGLLCFDDTDSVRGGCTTHTAFEIVRRLDGIDLVGLPRLVRLNPNVPWKTRGNGAVALPLGQGRGRRRVAGSDGGEPIWCYAEGEPLEEREQAAVFDLARDLIGRTSWTDDPKTHPGLAWFPTRPPPPFYWDAVHEVVQLEMAVDQARSSGASWRTWKQGRGLIGATAAAAWPAGSGTYEWIAYRHPNRWGTPRLLDSSLGPTLDREHPTTFGNYDAPRNHLRIAPRSPCPVLAGIRGTDPEDLPKAAALLGPEASAGALLFATNQATDDHLRPLAVAHLRPFVSALVRGTIGSRPRVTPGGHVFARLEDGTGTVTLAAYEPTKEFRHVVARLRPGDTVEAAGAVHSDTHVLALEKLAVLHEAPRVRLRPPRCAPCGVRAKSRGRLQGYRCRRCHARFRPDDAEPEHEPATPLVGSYEAPVLVRRHLARPLRFSRPPSMGFC